MSISSILEPLKDLENVQNVGVHFADEKGNLRRLSYGELVRKGSAFSEGLRQKGVEPGQAVILVMVNPENAIIAILGCMIAGCPPAPIYPPQNLRAVPNFLKFVKHVAQKCHAAFLVSESQPFALLGDLANKIAGMRGIDKFENILVGIPSATTTIQC